MAKLRLRSEDMPGPTQRTIQRSSRRQLRLRRSRGSQRVLRDGPDRRRIARVVACSLRFGCRSRRQPSHAHGGAIQPSSAGLGEGKQSPGDLLFVRRRASTRWPNSILPLTSGARVVYGPGFESSRPRVGSADDGHRQTRSTPAQEAVALRESLFLSYPRSGLGPSDDQNERSSAVRGAGDSERSRVRGLPGTKSRNRFHQTGQLLYYNHRCRRVGAGRRYLVSE